MKAQAKEEKLRLLSLGLLLILHESSLSNLYGLFRFADVDGCSSSDL